MKKYEIEMEKMLYKKMIVESDTDDELVIEGLAQNLLEKTHSSEKITKEADCDDCECWGISERNSEIKKKIVGENMMKNKNNMYALSAMQWNPFAGCLHNCTYCRPSFQAQLKRWAKQKCSRCYQYTPHTHPERLTQKLPRTHYMQFIFTCANGDISFCPRDYIKKIIQRIRQESGKTFLLQTKNPAMLDGFVFPKNVVLGTTIETNRDRGYSLFSKAPLPSQRYKDFLRVSHPFKMITVEPVMDFDIDVMIDWISNINPCMVWLGYDSKHTGMLPEPSIDKVRRLHWELSKKGFVVILKTIRAEDTGKRGVEE